MLCVWLVCVFNTLQEQLVILHQLHKAACHVLKPGIVFRD